MEDSPVINDDNADFTPMGSTGPRSPVINDSSEFVPMPTPDQVVRAENARLDAVPFEFADIRALAQRILKRATEKGQATIAAAQKQVADMEKAAYDKAYADASEKAHAEGLAKGEQEGMAQAEQKITAAIEAERESVRQNAAPVTTVLEELLGALDASRQQLMAQAEGDLLLLALDLAKRLVGHELSVDPKAIEPLALECIGLVTERTAITARVNSADFEVLQDFIPELKKEFPDLGTLQIIPDESIERGGLMAATRESEVDMRLATRLAAFEEAILGFSGDAAVAPWNKIPEEVIAEAKAKSAQSSYSLFDDQDQTPDDPGSPPPESGHREAEPEPAPAEPDRPDSDTQQSSDSGAPQSSPEGSAKEERPDPGERIPEAELQTAPGGDQSDMNSMMEQADLADLAELADLADQQPE